MNNNLEFDIVTAEMIDLQIQSLNATLRVWNTNIDSYLETYSMMLNAPETFKENDIEWIKGLLETAQYQKEKTLAEIEVKKSVKSFIK
jgi:hypothetical protein